jgi:hypothetical protein
MNDWDRVALAFDVLLNAEVMEEFEDCLWIKVDREMWEAFIGDDDGGEAWA